jgi:hypothetical protein
MAQMSALLRAFTFAAQSRGPAKRLSHFERLTAVLKQNPTQGDFQRGESGEKAEPSKKVPIVHQKFPIVGPSIEFQEHEAMVERKQPGWVNAPKRAIPSIAGWSVIVRQSRRLPSSMLRL